MNFTRKQDPTSRAIGLTSVFAFHVLLIWGLVVGLARKGIEFLPPPIETKIIEEEVKPPEEAPPPPRPDFVPPPPPDFEVPILDVAPPPAAQTNAIAIPQAQPAVAAPVKKASVRVAPKIDLKGSGRACREPEYPSASARLNEEGTAVISLLIGTDGKVEQSKVNTSSGFPRLDEATVKAFSKCKFVIGTNDGVAEASWFTMRYKWVVPN